MSDTEEPVVSDVVDEPAVTEVVEDVEPEVPEESEEVPVEEVAEPEEVPAEPVEPEVPAEPEEVPVAPSTEEVVETVQSILTSDTPVTTKTTEEKLDALIELLKSTSEQIEYDDNLYRWTGPLVSIREALENL